MILARRPLAGTVAANVLAYGTGGLNIDGCRIGNGGQLRWESPRDMGYHGGSNSDAPATANQLGRWPANLLLDEEAAALLDAQAGERGGGFGVRGASPPVVYGGGKGYQLAELGQDVGYGDSGGPSRFYLVAEPERDAEKGKRPGGFGNVGAPSGSSLPNGPMYGDSGGPSRFMYTAKASRSEREAGLEDFDAQRRSDGRDKDIDNPRLRTSTRRNDHPTVKPVSLMRWLCRLVTPPGGVVLDPFMGSGSTRVAALAEGMRFIGIDLEPRYVDVAGARLAQLGFTLEP